MENIRIALVSCSAPVGSTQKNLAQSEAFIGQARKAGAEIVCFPELNLTGYGSFAQASEFAVSLPGAVSDKVAQSARRHRITVLAGFIESNTTGKPYASHGVFWPDGSVETYRKLHLAPPEQPYFSQGNAIPVFEHAKATFGIQLCYDTHFPELSSAMALKGADIIFMPHASPRGDAKTKHRSWMRHLPARAFDNGVFIVACNQWGSNGAGLSFAGNAVALNPSGRVIASETAGGATMLVVDLKTADLEHVRGHRMRYFLPNRRTDLYG